MAYKKTINTSLASMIFILILKHHHVRLHSSSMNKSIQNLELMKISSTFELGIRLYTLIIWNYLLTSRQSNMENKALIKVTVIMPIYNTAAYLPEAIESICNQTLKELQIILINDGSTDNSQEIIEAYASKDPRIEWVKQKNAGLGCARNVGFKKAIGEFVYFMDSDDILKPDCLKQCYNLCYKNDLDYVTFDAESFDSSTKEIDYVSYSRKNYIDSNIIWESRDLLLLLLKESRFISSVCLCLYKREFLLNNSIYTPEAIIHEDQAFTLKVMLCAKKVQYIPIMYFQRRVRSHSIMTGKYSIRNIIGYTATGVLVKQWMKEKPEWEPYISLYLHKTLNSVIWLGHQLTWREKIKTIQLMIANHLCQYVSFRNWMVFFFK